jgi:hypothetical protein
MNAPVRQFEAKQAVLDEVPLLIGIIGPPGGGKTFSALRLATGMRKVRPGPIVLIDTERGRASKYAKDFDFLRVPFDPPFVPADFLQAVKAQLPLNPAAIIVDSLSDEHEGEGGVLDWHDHMIPQMGGNEWAAWSKPKASRRTMMNGLLQIKVPLIFTFRAREKTRQERNDKGKMVPVNIGYQPIAPSEIVYALDMTCILPPRADGVPTWKSDKIGEDFIIKLPNYLRPFVKEGQPLSEDMGKAFANWARGGSAVAAAPQPSASPVPPGDGEAEEQSTRIMRLDGVLQRAAVNGMDALKEAWAEISADDKSILKAALDKRHKITAQAVDEAKAKIADH